MEDYGYGLEFEYFRYLSDAFDLSIPVRINSAQVPLDDLGSATRNAAMLGLEGMLNYNIYKGKVFRPRLFAGVGTQIENLDDFTLNVPLGLGLNWYLGRSTSLTTALSYNINNEDLRDHWRLGAGIHIAIEDDKDPTPPVNNDIDGDGIVNTEDLCPDVPGTAALNGCPDKDGDGITDASDKCPDTPGIAQFEGCPDSDGDGVQDSADECPQEAGPIDNNGCPIRDRDGDGIVDDEDNCPDVVGTIANNGCPEKSLMISAKDKMTSENIPGVSVNLVNSSGQVVQTATTNNAGMVEFENVAPGDYTIQGKLGDIELESGSVATSDFNASDEVAKTIIYDDPNFIITGKVVLCNSTDPLAGVVLNLKNNDEAILKSTLSGSDGQFLFNLDTKATYELYAQKKDFLSQVVEVDANNYDRSKSVFVKLEVCAEEVECGEAVTLNNILYNTNSSIIRSDAYADLNNVVQFMRDNKDAKVELSAHTDSKGKASYNLWLSDRRAKSAADYIIAQGISADRIISKGYGETQLLNGCADGVKCSDAQHQANRRTEFKVICPD